MYNYGYKVRSRKSAIKGQYRRNKRSGDWKETKGGLCKQFTAKQFSPGNIWQKSLADLRFYLKRMVVMSCSGI